MANIGLSLDEAKRTLAAVAAHKGNACHAAKALGVNRETFRSRVRAAEQYREAGKIDAPEFETEPLPEPDLPIDDLLDRRRREYAQLHKAKEARRLINIKIKIDGPIAIAHFGDPHVDDKGCDIDALERDQNTVNKTKGMFAANLGDLQNNWVGRLSHLWSQQSTSAKEAWRLTEWHVNSCQWLYLIGGNHDAWTGDGDPLEWMMRQQAGVFGYVGTRINLIFPNGKQVRINARHDFSGHSMWNPNHGPMKAAQGGWRDHILTCGHKHVSFITGPLVDPATRLLTWAVRCAGYKTHDRYAEEKSLPEQNPFAAATTIIDPRFADDDMRLITCLPGVEEPADFLKFKRKRAGV
jgi:hypothetical protein